MALENPKVVVLVGGVGGAKLAYGLAQILPPENLTVVVNVADDFWHYGLRICPDSDTIMYTLSGLVDKTNGWGVGGDTVNLLDSLRRYGEDTWFRLGDQDMATHLLRTQMLHSGKRLTEVTRHLSGRLGIQCAVLPVTDGVVSTLIDTVECGLLEFQEYFVRHRWKPQVKSISYQGASDAKVTPEVALAVAAADIILFGPSNPWLSIEPILAIPGMRQSLIKREVPRVAVTPIVDGKALKGPAAKMMEELGYEVSPHAVAAFYGQVINGFIVDQRDQEIKSFDILTRKYDTIMNSDEDKIRLAQQVLSVSQEWGT